MTNPRNDFPLLVDAKCAAAMLGIGSRTLWSITQEGTLPHVRIRRRVLYSVEELKRWVAQHQVVGSELSTGSHQE